jgi:hypothetical protein
MATMKLLTDVEVDAKPTVKAVFDDIRAIRKSEFVNNFWRGMANDPVLLKRMGRAEGGHDGRGRARPVGARDDLHRGVDCERLRLLHSFAWAAGRVARQMRSTPS